MRTGVRVTSPAKINLCLGVGPVRADGYHPLATVYQAVGLYDELELERAGSGVPVLSVEGDVATAGVPTGPENLALRAVDLLATHHRRELPVALRLRKGIPVAGGLAGGSTDAAAALVGADALFDLRTPPEVLLELAGRLGSDVPFCLLGGTAVGSGRGEHVQPVPTRGALCWVVVPDAAGLSTPAVYREFDRLSTDREVPEPAVPADLLRALATGDAALLGASLRNDLEPAALSLRPDLHEVLATGRAGGDGVPGALGALVSGSGPTTVFLCADGDHARRLARHLQGALGRADGTAPFVVTAPAAGAGLDGAEAHR
jgi:4-diphosphocytidyl-2-C-methyl-D-erythritol kinase